MVVVGRRRIRLIVIDRNFHKFKTKVFEMDCATSPDYDGKVRYDACGPELQTEIDAVIRDFMCPDDETDSASAPAAALTNGGYLCPR